MVCLVSRMREAPSTPLCKGGEGGFFLVKVPWDSAVMPPMGSIIKAAPFRCGFFTKSGGAMLSWPRTRLGFRDQDFLPRGQAADHLDPICTGACAQAHIATDRSLLRFQDDEVELPHLCHRL